MERYRVATWGKTGEEAHQRIEEGAHQRIEEVLGIILESIIELGMPIPDEPDNTVSRKGCLATVSVQPKSKPALQSAQPTKTYQFRVVVEPGENQWFAHFPALEGPGVATGGQTREPVCINIHQVLRMTIESMISHVENIPVEALGPSAGSNAQTRNGDPRTRKLRNHPGLSPALLKILPILSST